MEYVMQIDHSRDILFSDFGKKTIEDRYLLENEKPQEMFARVAKAYANDENHAQRLYDYFSKMWAMPATPILSNGGTKRGLPISCFLSEMDDSMESIVDTWVENSWLGCKGGGIGTYAGNLRSVGEKTKAGVTSGVIPFLKVSDSQTLAIGQGSLRRSSAAFYMPIHHPEIEEFIEMRKATGGDPDRKCLNLHHGVCIPDDFMVAVENDDDYALLSPKDGSVIRKVKARDLWIRLLIARVETGEPYILFLDNANKGSAEHHKKLGMKIKTSNLCSEILLPTGKDYLDQHRTAVCCLSSLNLEKWHEWKDDENFIVDIMYFLDNILSDFIKNAPDTHVKAKYSAMMERSVALGVMGWHYLLQSMNLTICDERTYDLNRSVFSHIHKEVNRADSIIAEERGSCPDAINSGFKKRFSYKTGIAPTASISIICGNTSPSCDPVIGNVFSFKTLSGSHFYVNPYFAKVLDKHGMNNEDVIESIILNGGSVQHLDFLNEHEKNVFKTFKEIDQMDVIRLAAERQPFIDQGQSLNIFIKPDISKTLLHLYHYNAWKLGVKTMYYVRSEPLKRADAPSEKNKREVMCTNDSCSIVEKKTEPEICESCQ